MTDLQALELLKQNDQKGLEFLFDKYYDSLCRFAYLYYPNQSATEDIVSEFFIKLWERRDWIDITQSVKAYLFRGVHNGVLNAKRALKHEDSIQDCNKLLESKDLNPQEQLEFLDFQQQLDAYVNALPDRKKVIFELKLFSDLSNQEIASLLGLSINTVKNQLCAALKNIRSNLKV